MRFFPSLLGLAHGSFLFRDAVVFPLLAARIAGPFVFLGRLIRRHCRRRVETLKNDFLGMAFGTADRKLVEFLVLLFWSRIVLRLVGRNFGPGPGKTNWLILPPTPRPEIRGHPVHGRGFL